MDTIDIPEARSLEKVRAVVEAVQDGVTDKDEVASRTELSDRHVDYHRHAARVLGLLEGSGESWRVTPLGSDLLRTPPRSPEEIELLERAIRGSKLLEAVPTLLHPASPTLESLTAELELAGLSTSTARKRASALLAWRMYLRETAEK